MEEGIVGIEEEREGTGKTLRAEAYKASKMRLTHVTWQGSGKARSRRRRRDGGRRFWTGRLKPRSGRRNCRG